MGGTDNRFGVFSPTRPRYQTLVVIAPERRLVMSTEQAGREMG